MLQCWHWGREIHQVCAGEASHHLYKTPLPCWQLVQHSPFLLCPCLSRFHRHISKETSTPPRSHTCMCYFSILNAILSRFISHFCKMQILHLLFIKLAPLRIVSMAECCKQKVSSQTQGSDTMELKGVFPSSDTDGSVLQEKHSFVYPLSPSCTCQ